MPLVPLSFRPGINREVTPHSNEGGWVDCDKVRFREGFPETIGGWARSSTSKFLGVCRALVNWSTLSGAALLGIGTHLKYYIDRGGALFDITPIRAVTDAGDVTFAAAAGSTVLTVTHIAHGGRRNDFVTVSGAVSLGGAIDASVLNAEHQITKVINANTYEIEISSTATASDTGDGGAAVVGTYQLAVGLRDSFRGNGWGAGDWSEGGWGVPADTTIPGEQLRLWSHTEYGEDLIINPRGGGLFYWDASAGVSANRATSIAAMVGASQVPIQCNIVRLSEQDRHVLAFGCTPLGGGEIDPLLIRFSAQENFLEWNPTPSNTAGDLRISSGNQIVAVEQTSQQMLVLTDATAHVVQFVGPPFGFGIREVAAGISTAGPNAAVAANGTIYWMGIGAFYAYDGTVRHIPCSVKEYVFDITFDRERRDTVFAAHNSAFSEIWWLYPCRASGECTRYVVYNYEQNLWYYGTLARTAWVDRGVSLRPRAAGLDGYIYTHENGINDGSTNPPSPIAAHIESSAVDMDEGDKFMFAHRLVPDLTFRTGVTGPEATMTLTAQNFPGSMPFGQQPSAVSRSATVPVEQFTHQTFVRIRGRAVSLRVASNKVGTAWRLGTPRLDVRPDGRK